MWPIKWLEISPGIWILNQNFKIDTSLRSICKYMGKLILFIEFCKNFQGNFFLKVNINSPPWIVPTHTSHYYRGFFLTHIQLRPTVPRQIAEQLHAFLCKIRQKLLAKGVAHDFDSEKKSLMKPKSQPEAQIPAFKPRSQHWGRNPSLEAQIPALRPKS